MSDAIAIIARLGVEGGAEKNDGLLGRIVADKEALAAFLALTRALPARVVAELLVQFGVEDGLPDGLAAVDLARPDHPVGRAIRYEEAGDILARIFAPDRIAMLRAVLPEPERTEP
jgi:hypothetical protein